MSLNHDKTWDVFEGLAIFKSGWLYDEENYNVKIAFANVKISMHKSKNYSIRLLHTEILILAKVILALALTLNLILGST